MTDVPKDAREQLEAFARGHSMMTFGTESVPMWVLDLALAHLDLEAAAGEAVTWHRESVRSYTAHLGALYVGTVRDWTPHAQLFQDPSEILAKPWRATFSSEEDGEFELGSHATEAEAKAAVERKAAETFSALLLAGERRGLERAAKRFDMRAAVNASDAEWANTEGYRYQGPPSDPAKPLNHAAARYLEAVRDAAAIRALGRPA